jgi:hypothetical protein
MTMPQQLMMDAAKLRLRLQMNARLRLEVVAALSRVFREYRDPVTDDLLSTLVLAVPEELVGEAQIDQGVRSRLARASLAEAHNNVPLTPPPIPRPPIPRPPSPSPHVPISTPPPLADRPSPPPKAHGAVPRSRRPRRKALQ